MRQISAIPIVGMQTLYENGMLSTARQLTRQGGAIAPICVQIDVVTAISNLRCGSCMTSGRVQLQTAALYFHGVEYSITVQTATRSHARPDESCVSIPRTSDSFTRPLTLQEIPNNKHPVTEGNKQSSQTQLLETHFSFILTKTPGLQPPMQRVSGSFPGGKAATQRHLVPRS
jgi:hypothetical protein